MKGKEMDIEDVRNMSVDDLKFEYGEDGQIIRYRSLREIINIWYPGSIPEDFGERED